MRRVKYKTITVLVEKRVPVPFVLVHKRFKPANRIKPEWKKDWEKWSDTALKIAKCLDLKLTDEPLGRHVEWRRWRER